MAGRVICVMSVKHFQAVTMAPAWNPGSVSVTPTGAVCSATKVTWGKGHLLYIYVCECAEYSPICLCVLKVRFFSQLEKNVPVDSSISNISEKSASFFLCNAEQSQGIFQSLDPCWLGQTHMWGFMALRACKLIVLGKHNVKWVLL